MLFRLSHHPVLEFSLCSVSLPDISPSIAEVGRLGIVLTDRTELEAFSGLADVGCGSSHSAMVENDCIGRKEGCLGLLLVEPFFDFVGEAASSLASPSSVCDSGPKDEEGDIVELEPGDRGGTGMVLVGVESRVDDRARLGVTGCRRDGVSLWDLWVIA